MMFTQPSASLRRVSILAVDKVFASTLMQAKDFFHLASLRYSKQLGLGLQPMFEIGLVSPDGLPVDSFSNVQLPVDSGLNDADVIILPAFWDDFDALSRRYPQVLDWLRRQHASGTAIDLNAPQHPNDVPTSRTFTAKQIAEVHQILAECHGALRWGGDYTHTVDAMHVEVNVSPVRLKEVVAQMKKDQKPQRPTEVQSAIDAAKVAKKASKGKPTRIARIKAALKSLRAVKKS